MKNYLKYLLPTIALLFVSCSTKNTEHEFINSTSLKDFDGSSLIIVSGSLYELYVQDNMPGSKVLGMSSVSECLLALNSEKAEYMMVDAASLIGVDVSAKGCRFLQYSDDVSGPYAFAVNLNNTALKEQMDAFLAEIKSNGLYDEISERWTGSADTDPVMPEISSPEGNVLEVASYSLNYPFTYVSNGEYVGMEVEILKRFGEYIGRPVHITGYEFASLMPALASGKAELIAGTITVTEERAKKILFAEPYYFSNTVLLVKDYESSNKTNIIESVKKSFTSNLIEDGRWKMLVSGLWETVRISFFSIIFGTLIGALICWMKRSRKRILRGIAYVYVEILRGIPMLVFLMVMFYVVLAASPLSATWIAVVAFAMNFGAFVSEIFNNGISAVDKGQTEAGLALGFTKIQTFVFVVLPQSLKHIVPVFKNEAISLVKNTSIVGYIAIQDLTKMSDLIRNRTFDAFFPLIIISIIYFILAWLLGKLLDVIVKK